MKISEVTIMDLKEYAHVYHNEDDKLFTTILAATKGFISTYTGLTLEVLDPHEDVSIALFVLSNEMYDNRLFTVDSTKLNFVIKQILDSHSVNLL